MNPPAGPLGSLANCRAIVLGLGRFGGGAGAARYLAERGARVLVTDLRTAEELPEARAELAGLDLEWVLGEHRLADFEGAELVVANPAVPSGSSWLQHARQSGARVTTEIELFLGVADCKTIGITGTHGKTSTASFTVQLLEAAGLRAHLGGNAGGSLLGSVENLDPEDVAVLELSSYQLEHLGTPPLAKRGLDAAAITCLGNDHLGRHGDAAGYAAAKRRIAELMRAGAPLVLGGGLDREPSFARLPGARGPNQSAISSTANSSAANSSSEGAAGLPEFQRRNAALARDLVASLGIPPPDSQLALRTPPHRLEQLPALCGMNVFDNAVSTTPESTAAALESLPGPVVLLAGGRSKELPWEPLLRAAEGRLRAAVTFGEVAAELTLALRARGLPAVRADDLGTAVALAAGLGRPGDTLLFSPAASSFDAFPNFQERARVFRGALDGLRELPAAHSGGSPPRS